MTYGTPSLHELVDLTRGEIPLLTYETGRSFSGGGKLLSGEVFPLDVRYLVRVKNQNGDTKYANSLVVVMHQIQEMNDSGT